jgi:hypothetical protein
MKVKVTKLERLGQVKKDDCLALVSKDGKIIPAKAELVNFSKSHNEEVIYNLDKNHYFIVHMLLEGKSHIKEVFIIELSEEVNP